MSRVDDLIDQLGGAYYITTMDLTRGYWQVPVSEDAKQKTAFATPFGLYQFNRMPFGLKGASATFQRLVDRVLRNLESVCGAYIDNLIILSKLWEKHVSHIRAVLERLKGAGLTAKPSKCCFETTSCTYLGHVVGSGAVRPEPSKWLQSPDFEKPFILQTDASDRGLGAVLSQRDDSDSDHLVAYYSRKLLTTGREVLYYRKGVPRYKSVDVPLPDLI
ncbi:hypothetical protein EMCRGX_G022207 [Ephydatia muelleri]